MRNGILAECITIWDGYLHRCSLGHKEDIFGYINKNFLVVIDKQVFIDDILFDMGVKIS